MDWWWVRPMILLALLFGGAAFAVDALERERAREK